MYNVFLANFAETVEMQYGTSAKNALQRAVRLEYTFDEMVRLVALYRRESDPFLNVEEFVKNGASMGIGAVLQELRDIMRRLPSSCNLPIGQTANLPTANLMREDRT
ncbi:MAG: hypothetical protein IJ735_05090 [Clostridia bacterium]|nr:hypothetical protein [Clostridia bacterium]